MALRGRHRRLCKPCTKVPMATLVSPALDPETSLLDDAVQREICKCESDGVWLCQPCGRSMRGADNDYQRYVYLPADSHHPAFEKHQGLTRVVQHLEMARSLR